MKTKLKITEKVVKFMKNVLKIVEKITNNYSTLDEVW